MESKANYTMVGIAVVFLTLGLVTIGLWLSIGFDHKNYGYYTVYMKESIAGLTDESLVRYNGVKVGTIAKIDLNKNNPQEVKLLLKIEEGTPIFEQTRATLVTQGITGTTFLGLSANSPSKISLKIQSGERYPIIAYEPSFLNQLQKTVTDLSQTMKQFLSEENAKNLERSLKSLSKIMSVFSDNETSINDTLRQMPELTKNLQSSVNSFDKMSRDLSTAGQQLSLTMRSTKEAIDQVSQQALPTAMSLLKRIDVIAGDLEEVSEKMGRNPSVLIWGSPPLKKGPGE